MQRQRWILYILFSGWLFLWGAGLTLAAPPESAALQALTQLIAPLVLTIPQEHETRMEVRLFAQDRPVARQPLRLTWPDGQEQTAQTNAEGIAHFRLETQRLVVGQHGLRLVFPGTPELRPAISVIKVQIAPALASPLAGEQVPEIQPLPPTTQPSALQPIRLADRATQSGAVSSQVSSGSQSPLGPAVFRPITGKNAGVANSHTLPTILQGAPYLLLLPAGVAVLITAGIFLLITVNRLSRWPRLTHKSGSQQSKVKEPAPVARPRRRLQRVLLQHLATVKGGLALATFAILGNTLMDLLGPWPLKVIFDHILLEQPLPPSLTLLADLVGGQLEWLLVIFAGALALIAGLGAAFSYLETYVTSRIGFQLVTTLRRELFAHLQRLPLSFFQQTQRGEVLTKVSSDTQTLRDLFTESGLTLITNSLTVIGMFAVMLWVNWQLALIPLLSMPLILLICARIQSKVTASTRSQRKKEGKITAQLSENLAIMPVVQAFGRERYEVERFNDVNDQNLAEGIQVARLSAAMTRTITAISAFCLALVVSYGGWLVLQGKMTPGDVLLFVTYVKSMYKPLREVVKLLGKITKGMVSAQRIAEILDIEPEVEDKPNARIAPRLRGAIRFRKVAFGYSGNQPILRDLSLEIPAGRRVALVGSSGAGKSTVINLLLRLYDPQQGEIYIDGVDLRDYQRESYRSQIGLVLQDSLLFSATIRENIAYGKPNATLDEIKNAARQAYIHDFITSLPQGYDTVISELGGTLSGGQRQRIAIARALVKQPSILILDEPTSALDAESRTMVQQTLQRIAQGKTLLVIAHQLSTIQDFDEILVMHKGRIVERGAHDDLLQCRGYYAQLHRLQGYDASTPGSESGLPTTQLLPALQIA